jgi:hypothetical protein
MFYAGRKPGCALPADEAPDVHLIVSIADAHPPTNNNVELPPKQSFQSFARSMLSPPLTTLPLVNCRYTIVSRTQTAEGPQMEVKYRCKTLQEAHWCLAEYKSLCLARDLSMRFHSVHASLEDAKVALQIESIVFDDPRKHNVL